MDPSGSNHFGLSKGNHGVSPWRANERECCDTAGSHSVHQSGRKCCDTVGNGSVHQSARKCCDTMGSRSVHQSIRECCDPVGSRSIHESVRECRRPTGIHSLHGLVRGLFASQSMKQKSFSAWVAFFFEFWKPGCDNPKFPL